MLIGLVAPRPVVPPVVIVYFFRPNLLSCSSKRQGTISRPSFEAKYRDVANTVAETSWLRNLLRELLYPPLSTMLVYCDNTSDAYLSTNVI